MLKLKSMYKIYIIYYLNEKKTFLNYKNLYNITVVIYV